MVTSKSCVGGTGLPIGMAQRLEIRAVGAGMGVGWAAKKVALWRRFDI